MKKLHNKEDCSIIRNDESYPGEALLIDEEGDVVFSVSDIWTDEQIFHALDFANDAYESGVYCGRTEKAREICKALEMSE